MWLGVLFQTEVCSRRIALKRRLRLFEACVTPCSLHARSTWTMTQARERLLTCARRKMLRWMVSTPRRAQETFVDYIICSTHHSEDLAAQHGSTDWVVARQKQKSALATKTAGIGDLRWTKRLLNWKPWFRCRPHRSVGCPVRKWVDDLP